MVLDDFLSMDFESHSESELEELEELDELSLLLDDSYRRLFLDDFLAFLPLDFFLDFFLDFLEDFFLDFLAFFA